MAGSRRLIHLLTREVDENVYQQDKGEDTDDQIDTGDWRTGTSVEAVCGFFLCVIFQDYCSIFFVPSAKQGTLSYELALRIFADNRF